MPCISVNIDRVRSSHPNAPLDSPASCVDSYAHLFAIKDSFMGTHAAWVPSGAGRSK